ncbi:MAG: hypothetical protein WBI34_10975 [Tenuifilaceae bacterium]|jgi:exopolyphosphatase/guanosine-5'-triphosphate,3'-diphosphate pyrophosphatase|nr:hypothetical protein [Bacteroidales bacterium]MDI9517343.1 exopolyphosphatase [Bacteroidota bacterium]NLH56163.1 exopolyphosphatase [Rikenellaceae bacterium]OQC61362.1 MAG: Exopolyphosphatase [Bacteroidetes bacterium ADurb.Bin008]HNV80320.1 hypothetical protein [Tenuifilaceae bacterium]
MRKVAVIDLGTNIFHLVVAAVNDDGTFQITHSEKLPVKLGEGGITQGVITPEAIDRGMGAIGELMRTALLHGSHELFAFATSAIRNASNGDAFVSEVKNLFGIDAKIITGDEEAELIYFGIRLAAPLNEQNVLMVDIGGGSNEIIIGNSQQLLWKRSYNLGVARLVHMFNPSDPIEPFEIAQIERYIENELSDLIDPVAKYKPTAIIGSSGSFDTYRSVLTLSRAMEDSSALSANIPIDEYIKLHNYLLTTTAKQRYAIPGMEPVRVEFIVSASIFTHFLIKNFGIKSMMQSSYSLKEGALWKLVNS